MKKVSTLQMALTLVYVAALMISNTITAKLVQLPFEITMTAAVVVFPVTYVLSDVFSECYGYEWSRATCYASFALNIFMVGAYQLAIAAPAPAYFEAQEAFSMVLGSTPRVLGASMLAFIVGDFINDNIFKMMKAKHEGMDGFGIRALLSSAVGEFCDSAVFIPLAFFGEMPLEAMLAMAACEAAVKVTYELVILPVTRRIARKVNLYEMELEHSEQ